MNQTKTLKTACKCAQFCMLRMSMCVASFLLLSTMVSMNVLKVYLSLYTLLRSHLFVNCCIRRYFIYPIVDKGLRLDDFHSFEYGMFDRVRIGHAFLGTLSLLAFLFQLVSQIILFVSWLFPISVSMRSSFLVDILRD